LPRIGIILIVTFLMGYLMVHAQLGFIINLLLFLAFILFIYLYETQIHYGQRKNHQ